MSIVRLQDATDAAVYGGKAWQLGAALRAGLPVPAGYGVSVDALLAVTRAEVAVLERLREVLQELAAPVAARSSAVGEDSLGASFAGQHLTVLNLLDHAALIAALCAVYASAHSEAAAGYRKKKGIDAPIRIAAVVQRLLDPICAGVLFTRNPLTGADERVIEAAWGLGQAVVAGVVTPDHYRIARDGHVLEARIADKGRAIRRAQGGGTCEVDVESALISAPCLDASGLAALHALAARCEVHFGRELDLEWARVGDQIHLLQARPITTGRDP